MSDVENYLETMCLTQLSCSNRGREDWKYLSIEDFVLKEGQMFTAPDDELPEGVSLGTVKECFKNCINAVVLNLYADKEDDYFYCEGYALGIIPMLHAWLITPEGKVVDPTWRDPGTEYFGVAFKRRFAQRQTMKQGYYGLLDAYPSRWPLLQGIAPKEWRAELNLTGENV